MNTDSRFLAQAYSFFGILKVSMVDCLAHPKRILSNFLVLFVRVGVMFALYAYAFKYVGRNVNGISFEIAIWSIAIYFIILATYLRYIFVDINTDVVSGKIETIVTKPVNYLLYRYALKLGAGLGDMLFVLIAVSLILGLTIGIPAGTHDLLWVLEVILITVLGMVITLLMYSLIALGSFWIDNARPFFWIVDKLVLVLGGSYVPIALFPIAIKLFAIYSPFGASMFATYIFNPDFAEKFVTLVGVQVMWILVFLILIKFVFGRAMKRLSVNGG